MSCELTTVYENCDEKTIHLKLAGLDGVEPSEVTLEAKIAGNLESKRALAIFHGAHLNHHFMEFLTPWFDELKLIYFSAPGRLGSSPIETVSADAYAAIFSRGLACLREQGEFDALDILGYSMGGYLGTKVSLMGEVKVDHLVYLHSTAGGPTGIDDTMPIVYNEPEKAYTPEILGSIAMNGFAPGTTPEFMNYVASIMPVCGADPVWMVNDMIAIDKSSFLEQLDGMPAGMRFMFVNGLDDRIVPNSSSKLTEDKLRAMGFDVTVLEVPDCGHIDWPNKLHNDLLTGERGIASHVREFLNI